MGRVGGEPGKTLVKILPMQSIHRTDFLRDSAKRVRLVGAHFKPPFLLPHNGALGSKYESSVKTSVSPYSYSYTRHKIKLGNPCFSFKSGLILVVRQSIPSSTILSLGLNPTV